MAKTKKIGKALLFTAAAVSAAAAVCYYLQKKESAQKKTEEDYDDFSEDLEEDTESTRSYVSLNHDTTEGEATEGADTASAAQTVEEFPVEDSASSVHQSSSVDEGSSHEESAPAQQSSSSSESSQTHNFTPLTEQVAQAADKATDAVEEFFDEEDSSDTEPPIHDNE